MIEPQPLPFPQPASRRPPDDPTLEVSATLGQARAVAAVAMLASCSVYALLWEAPEWSRWTLVGLAAALLLARAVAPLVAILLWVWGLNLLLEGRGLAADDRLDGRDWLTALVLIAFVVFALRCLELQGHVWRRAVRRRGRTSPSAQLAALWKEFWPKESPDPASQEEERPSPREPGPSERTRQMMTPREPITVLLRPLSGVAGKVVLAPTAAAALLWLTPWETMADNAVRLVPSAYRVVVFFWLLAVTPLVLGAAFSLVRWPRLSPRQAGVYLRWTLAHELRREQPPVERARARRTRRQRDEE